MLGACCFCSLIVMLFANKNVSSQSLLGKITYADGRQRETKASLDAVQNGMLFPRESESRQIKNLEGIWSFRADMSSSRNEGFDKKWYQQDLYKVCLIQ